MAGVLIGVHDSVRDNVIVHVRYENLWIWRLVSHANARAVLAGEPTYSLRMAGFRRTCGTRTEVMMKRHPVTVSGDRYRGNDARKQAKAAEYNRVASKVEAYLRDAMEKLPKEHCV